MGQSLLSHEIVKRSHPFNDLQDFAPLIDRCKDKKVVMLGEATHGTKEFYEWRNAISAELIRHHGFKFIAIEGDWPASQEVNRFIQRHIDLSSFEVLSRFSRWPTWMWGNTEMVAMMDWLREWNLGSKEMVGFHGLDVYSLFDSINEVLDHLRKIDPLLARKVRDYYSCLEPYEDNEKAYARSLFNYPTGCTQEVTKALKEILEKSLSAPGDYFDVTQNARIVANAEAYYRAVVFEGRSSSWNIRDHHMMETLENLMNHYGDDSKIIVWAHNTHIGDYRATDMILRDKINLGGLAREKYGAENVALVGFSTYTGSVIASHAWGGMIEVMEVPEAKGGSLEASLHEAVPLVGHPDYYLMFDEVEEGSPLLDYRGHRAIGVIYQAGHELRGNYVPTAVARRYDALIFLDETKALSPLAMDFDYHKIPETYPYGTRI